MQSDTCVALQHFTEEDGSSLSAASVADLDLLLAQHLFASFMWSIAHHIPQDEISKSVGTNALKNFVLLDSSSWTNCKIESESLDEAISDIRRNGAELGNEETIALLMIPPLSWSGKLPSESIVDLIWDRIMDEDNIQNIWAEAPQIFISLLEFCRDSGSPRLAYKAVAAYIEFLLIARTRQAEHIVAYLKDKLLSYEDSSEGQLQLVDVTSNLRLLYKYQMREHEYTDIFQALGEESMDKQDLSQLGQLFGFSSWHYSVFDDAEQPFYRPERVFTDVSSVYSRDVLGWTPLHYAAVRNFDQCFDHLASKLNQSRREAPRDMIGRTPFHCFAAYNQEATGVYPGLISMNKSDVKDRAGMRPLHWIARAGNIGLIQPGFDRTHLNSADDEGRTPLHLALSHKQPMLARVLVWLDADVSIRMPNRDTALHIAAKCGHVGIVELLIEKIKTTDGNLNEGGFCEETALFQASREGHAEIVKLLLGGGADPAVADRWESSPLHVAQTADVAIELLSGREPTVQRRLLEGERSKFSPLVYAVSEGRSGTAKVLIAHGADIDARSFRGETPLLLASQRGQTDVVSSIIEVIKNSKVSGADDMDQSINAQDDDGYTALHCAASQGYISVLGLLIDAGANIDIPNKDDETPLSIATKLGHVEAVEFLFRKGKARLDIGAIDGMTVLEYAEKSDQKIATIFRTPEKARASEVPGGAHVEKDSGVERETEL